MVVHLHGGGLREHLFDRHGLLRRLNRVFLKRVGGVVVLGKTMVSIFDGMVPAGRVHVVANFADESLFARREEIERKFERTGTLRVLFLSNLLAGKGHEELAEACLGLEDPLKRRIRVDFAGGFESDRDRERFLRTIQGNDNLNYLGTVSGEEKRRLLAEAHLFCLPTYYAFEGQPISILEAYASGCVVVTTNHAGIRDIFRDGENGYRVQAKSARSIRDRLEAIAADPAGLADVALRNQRIASERYREDRYCGALIGILEHMADGSPETKGASI
jgi:glycosyltransferase involved in cell wall biosynthesis